VNKSTHRATVKHWLGGLSPLFITVDEQATCRLGQFYPSCYIATNKATTTTRVRFSMNPFLELQSCCSRASSVPLRREREDEVSADGGGNDTQEGRPEQQR